MKILGIETSCDDTGAALVEATDDGFVVLSEKTASQIEVHKKYGGVVPEIAGRQHAENILPVIEAVLKNQEKPDVIAVTAGPGLMTGLLIGVEAAKTLSYLWEVPLVAINHIEGHIHSVLIGDQKPKFSFPALCLTVSGGHTKLILINDFGDYTKIGETRDDAAGECFDKVGKLIGLDYPGGPKISKLAESGNPDAIDFPRPMINEGNFDFSFSGLKTAALYWLQENTEIKTAKCELSAVNRKDFCASFEQAIVDVLVTKTIKAAKKYKPKTIILAGGVSANKKLRETVQEASKTVNCELLPANPKYSMDNAAMIAAAAYHHALKKDFICWKNIEANPNWKLT
ncbi:MAG: tRNA (adenosine(37)-N6)-threonylcarbamoyltransferase complex transferase subunit TsaD [Candidatus Magasanikbacteria bacterium]|nr:tRNA (adenosine(37)-N6)-threonylcarbamoyltransferase complex transferase subunit TsaD [Candidatus Magasanikbacteria bacterium]